MAVVRGEDCEKGNQQLLGVARVGVPYETDWLEYVSPIDGHGRDALDFYNLSLCQQMVRNVIHIAVKQLDLALTEVKHLHC